MDSHYQTQMRNAFQEGFVKTSHNQKNVDRVQQATMEISAKDTQSAKSFTNSIAKMAEKEKQEQNEREKKAAEVAHKKDVVQEIKIKQQQKVANLIKDRVKTGKQIILS